MYKLDFKGLLLPNNLSLSDKNSNQTKKTDEYTNKQVRHSPTDTYTTHEHDKGTVTKTSPPPNKPTTKFQFFKYPLSILKEFKNCKLF